MQPPTGAAVKRLMREINELRKNPPEGIRVQTNDEDMLDVTGIIEGPEGTPYAGGYFRVRFKFTEEFPAAPPKCWFATKLFHPNVGPSGEICVNTLKKDWKSTYGIGHILVTVKCLLIYPNPESALDEEAGKLLMEDYESYCSRAKLITSVHATPRTRPVEFDTPSRPDGDEKEKVSPKAASSSTESVASTSKTTTIATPTTTTTTTTATTATVTTPVVSTPATTATSPPVSTASIASRLGLPTAVPRKASSPAPSSYTSSMSLKSSSTLSMENSKDGSVLKNERHASPAPLSTADANVEGKAKMGLAGSGLGLGLAPGAGLASANGSAAGGKSMKRAATNSAVSGAEKRKKALKRL
ncbi:hypothetical protein D9611_000746 [Ephemerocybe angulata]|uniref:E2 ubiquitin-conjugating enzyme n=1 Tax=Ephemerocybe angulata TaxID=980116 RepID=A0A8H5BMB9_9AGAR|nr:hypothetical protein D9611_000746 [Tulosesus angulatus]